MFRRSRNQGTANRLRIEARPNELSWTSGDADDPAGRGPDPILESDSYEDEAEDELEDDDPQAAARRAAELQAELERQAEEFGLTGSNAAEMYGPNGEAVVSLLDSLPTIDYATAEAIADAYEAIPEAERKVAQTVVRRRHRGGELGAELRTAEAAVYDWHASLLLTDEDEALYGVVADAATDAVDALVLVDELADVDFATLYGAWSEVMEAAEEEDESEPPEGSAETAAGAGTSATGDAGSAAEDVGEFGPNTALVVEFLARLGALEPAQIAEVVAAWRERPREELKIAHRAVQALADEDATWREQLRLAQEEIFAWMEGRTTEHQERAYVSREDTRIRETAGPAVADAVAALVMADMLEPEDAAALYAPWAEAVGEPALPEYEDDDSD